MGARARCALAGAPDGSIVARALACRVLHARTLSCEHVDDGHR